MSGRVRLLALLPVVFVVTATAEASAQNPATHADFARTALKAAGGVKPGEVVMIGGGIHVFPLIEEIAAHVYRAGGMPVFTIATDRLAEAGMMESLPDHFAARDMAFANYMAAAYDAIDVHIRLPYHAEMKDRLTRFRRDSVRIAAARAARVHADARLLRAHDESHARFVDIAYPFSAEDIAPLPMSQAEHDRMMLEAATVDPEEIDRLGRAVARRSDQARTMRLTTPGGTDIRVTLAGVPAVVLSPMIPPDMMAAPTAARRTAWLPGGQVAVLLKDDEAEGRVAIRGDQCGDTHVTNIRFTVEQGVIRGLEADTGGECIRNFFDSVPEPVRRLSSIRIGLNPAMKVIDEDIGYRPWIALGVVHLTFGYNSDIGGTLSDRALWGFPLVNPTIEVDGVTIMRDGRFIAELATDR